MRMGTGLYRDGQDRFVIITRKEFPEYLYPWSGHIVSVHGKWTTDSWTKGGRLYYDLPLERGDIVYCYFRCALSDEIFHGYIEPRLEDFFKSGMDLSSIELLMVALIKKASHLEKAKRRRLRMAEKKAASKKPRP